MKNYILKYQNMDYPFSGDNLIDAIETNFKKLMIGKIGNAAGYVLENAWIEYDPSIIGGKGGAVLHVSAEGSDALINHEPHPPKKYEFWIKGVTPAELSARHDFKMKEEIKFNPFEGDGSSLPMPLVIGIIIGLRSYIGAHYCSTNYFDTFNKVSNRFPTLLQHKPLVFLQELEKEEKQLRPTKEADRLRARISDLEDSLSGVESLSMEQCGQVYLYLYKTRDYLNKEGKITALAYYRNKAGKTQAEMAEESGIALRSYQRYESMTSGLGDAKYSVVEKIAQAVGVTTDKLVKNGLVLFK